MAAAKTFTVTSGATSLTGATSGDALTVSNSTSTGNIAVFKDNSTAVATIADGGATTFQNTTNSVAAFQIQNSSGSNLLNANTSTTYQLVTNGNFETSVNGWEAYGGTTVSVSTDESLYGLQSLKLFGSTAANEGALYWYPLKTSTTYSLSFWARLLTGSTSSFSIGHSTMNNGSTAASCLTSQTVNTTWTKYTCTFATGGTGDGAGFLLFEDDDTTARTYYLDGVSLVASGTAIDFNSGGNQLDLQANTGNVLLNQQNSGELQAWQLSRYELPASRVGSIVIANGYIYSVGGSLTTNVYYARLNTDGSSYDWTSTTSLPITADPAVVTANGYIYSIGGCTSGGCSVTASVYYAKLNADGTIGNWTATTSLPSSGMGSMNATTANGYVYTIGGYNGSYTVDTVYYAKLKADGTVSGWNSTSNLPAARDDSATIAANGFIYAIGGNNSSGNSQSDVYYAELNADGTLTSWDTAASLPAARTTASVVANGYVYAIGGCNNAGWDCTGTAQSTVYYAKLNNNGTIGGWFTATNSLPLTLFANTATANGYIYMVGGWNGASSQPGVYYTSTSRITLGGSLDLVGLGGQNLADGGDFSQGSTGGTLTAGNTTIVGSLQVAGQANFSQGVNILGNLAAGETALKGNATIGTKYGNRLFSDGFESGNFNLWSDSTTGTISVDTAVTHNGEYSIKVNPSSGKGYVTTSLAPNSTAYARAWAYVDSVAQQFDLLALGTDDNGFFLHTNTSAQLCLWNGVLDSSEGCWSGFTTDAWHLIELRITVDTASTGTSQVWLDGTQVFSSTNRNNGTTDIGFVTAGNGCCSRTATVYIDDVSVDTSANGTGYSLNVDDSFHVGGTASFGNSAAFSGNVLVKPTTNSSTAFQVQNSSGSTLFNANTSTTYQLVQNGNFETSDQWLDTPLP